MSASHRHPKALLVVSSLAPSGRAQMLRTAAPLLPAGSVHVCVLGPETPWCEPLRRAGVPVDVLGWHRPVDLASPLALRSLLRRQAPDVVHAWSADAAWAVALTGAAGPARLVVSGAAAALTWANRQLLRRCAAVVAFGEAEAARYRAAGVGTERVAVVPLGVAPIAEEGPVATGHDGVADDDRVVLCVGPVTAHKGHREAAWAFDMIRHLVPRSRLVIVGDGPALVTVRRFLRGVRAADQTTLVGPVDDPAPWYRRAELVWVPSLREGGRCVAMEAMAAGRAVVASRLPGLAEVIDDGRTGVLVPPDDKVALATAGRALLEDEGRCAAMGGAGREAVRDRFEVGRTAEALARVYSEASVSRRSPGAAPGG